ncbi:glycosyltransferase [Streptomyces phage Annadreamy]|uniref:Glycosyltransferase n=2 Tax=Annadreamyvirus annadreamy TaxID=2846392 RepID=A0A345GTC3_9CAUD|nr:glycosyltransferase [Streptomyces phage Annadreamy]AXG66195.1 glycosyltransferase [Streptomyces phage Annadreamy]QGH79407.1 glycosyltransferase [Streptomyces phage Limpid]
MKYTIFNVTSERQHYIDMMLPKLSTWERAQTYVVDARIPEEFEKARKRFPYQIKFDAKIGHMGIWYSVLTALENAPIVTFEDDALLHDKFIREFDARVAELPEDFDFFSLFVPRDSDHMYASEKSAGWYITRTYQRYGGVSMYYSKQGAEKIKALLERDDITGQYDDTLYEYSKTGELNGYCSKPSMQDLVFITGSENSSVQDTDYL